MILKDFGKLGWKVSAIGLGTWNIGNQWGDINEDTAQKTITAAHDAGVNLFDTAESYGIPNGLSEDRLGKALADMKREAVFVVSKVGNWGKRTGQGVPKTTVDMIRLCAHASLGRLQTSYHDVLLCHEGNIEDPTIYLEGFEVLIQEGRLRAYGISTNDLNVLKRFNVNHTCSVVQVDYSLVNRKPEADFLPYCKENGIGVMVRGPLAMGLLSGHYSKDTQFKDTVRSRWHNDAEDQAAFEAKIDVVDKLKAKFDPGVTMIEAALRYTISHPAVSTVIPGAKSPAQASMNAQMGASLFTHDELSEIRSLLDLKNT